MKALIVYATRQGQTAKITERVAEYLRARGHEAQVQNLENRARDVDPAGFDMVFVGAPIHVGGYPRAVSRFVRKHPETLARVPSAFLSVGLAVASRTSDGRAQTMPIVERFLARTGWRPQRVELVAGALPYSKYNPLVRFIMRRIAKAEGGDTDTSHDYEYTDWDALERFVVGFVEGSPGGVVAAAS
jgi:menaquinone-dependent protoporphyrinogen oxidase